VTKQSESDAWRPGASVTKRAGSDAWHPGTTGTKGGAREQPLAQMGNSRILSRELALKCTIVPVTWLFYDHQIF